ncbi:MAG: 4-alpha-glucanotransferase [Planctomycetes bacterium]|nr:4-alpha-glucanotransferase [Planctomycetota bacterium]
MSDSEALLELARALGVATSYVDMRGATVHAGAPALVAVTRALGAELERAEDAPRALAALRERRAARLLPEVLMAWHGRVRVPWRARGEEPIEAHLTLEDGTVRALRSTTAGLRRALGPLPLGVHTLDVRRRGRIETCTVLAAPRRAFLPPPGTPDACGIFLPLHAARSERNLGAGDFLDLAALLGMVAGWRLERRPGRLVGTLPFLAGFFDAPCDPSPYSPASRLFWNEFYVAVDEAAAAFSAAEREQIASLRAAELVDYPAVYALKRKALLALAPRVEADPAYWRFLAAHPEVEDYARFRAAGARHGRDFRRWPSRLRDGAIATADVPAEEVRFHRVAQYLAEHQVDEVAARAHARGLGLYLDLPLGVHGDSYDLWRHREAFVTGARVGAPPDPFFTTGQDWGFPPPHPEGLRRQRYGYLRACLAHSMRHAAWLRIDHVMGLHRMFWIPPGLDPSHGVYVHYPAHELYALVCLESLRHGCVVAGEDLGIVPPYVRPAMARHGLQRLYVLQCETGDDPARPLAAVPRACLASLNTHDLPTFAAEWGDLAGHHRAQLVLRFLAREGCAPGGPDDLAGFFRASLRWLGRSPARMVLANLEDLWGETRPQNVPGTESSNPNWRRKARFALDEIPDPVPFDTEP